MIQIQHSFLAAAPVILKELKSIRLMEGSDLTFESKISGTPIPKVTWYKDDREIIPGETITSSYLVHVHFMR